MQLRRIVLMTIFGGLLCAPMWADLLGTSVTGSLHFGGVSNLFDPAIGFVPVGPLNKTLGTTVTIQTPAVEFGFQDGINADTADFTGTQLTLTDVSAGGSAPATYTFVDAAFAGLTLSTVSNTFGAGVLSAGLSGTTLTINTALFFTTGTKTAVFGLAPAAVPEPGSISLLFTALAGIGWAVRKKLA